MELTDYRNIETIANPYVVKCILLGDRGIGKSTMLNVLSTGRFDPNIVSTIGIDFAAKTISLPEYNNHKIKLQIWDTAGQEKFKSIVRSYLRDAYIGFLIFDLTDRNSWNNLVQWKEDLENSNNRYEGIPHIVLVGTKSDLRNRVISAEEIKKRSEEWGCKFYMITSKQNNSHSMIYRIFTIAVEDLHQDIIYKHINGHKLPHGIYKEDNDNVKVGNWIPNEPKRCCQ